MHKQLFKDVWEWAGEYRRTNKNIGVDKYLIGIELRKLLEDCRFWINNNTFSADEISLRLSHRIVSIHPFANGNGRHSRLIADVLIYKGFGKPFFSWGRNNLSKDGEIRRIYLSALREADQLNYLPLLKFART